MILDTDVAAKTAFWDAMSKLPFLQLELQGTLWLEPEPAMELAMDCFAWFYGSPKLDLPRDVPMAGVVIAGLLAQPTIIASHAKTLGSQFMSIVALQELWAAMNSLFPLLGRIQGSEGKDSGNGSDASDTGNFDDAMGEAGADAARHIQDTSEVARQIQMALPATGWDLSRGKMVRIDLEDIETLAELVRQKEWLYALIELLGRIEEMGSIWDPMPLHAARGEIHSVGRGGDIENMLPSEAMMLQNPRTRSLFFARLYERSLLAYTMQTSAKEGGDKPGGPMIALVDTSGSMQGSAETVAKAFVLAAARLARLQRRRFLLGIFGSQNEYEELELVGKSTNPGKFLSFLAQSFHGGTDFDGPVQHVCAKIVHAGWEAADCLIITDGLGLPSARTISVVNAVRRQFKTVFMGIIVGNARARGLDKLLDYSFFTDGQNIEAAGKGLKILKQSGMRG